MTTHAPRGSTRLTRHRTPARWAAVVLAGILGACSDVPTAVPPAGLLDLSEPWAVASPGAVDLSGPALFVAGDVAGRTDRVRSLVVARRGRLAYERYYGGFGADSLADVRSVTKSIVSILTGIAIEEGAIEGTNQPVTDVLRAPRYAVRPEHASVTIGTLLTMTSGIEWQESGAVGYDDWQSSDDHVAYLLERPIISVPGSTYRYNSAAVHLLGVILEEATGESLAAYADRVLFGPLGVSRTDWEPSTGGHLNGGSGLDLRPRDLARVGQLLLQEGWSGGRTVLPPDWVAESTALTISGLGRVGPIDRLAYGYLWWLDVDRDAYFAWGYGGQFLYVDPELELVVVVTTEWRGASADIGAGPLQEQALSVIVDRVLAAVR